MSKTPEQLEKERAKYKRYRERHPERCAAAQKAYKQSHRETVNTIQARYRSRLSPERKAEFYHKRSIAISSQLTDTYVKKLLTRSGTEHSFRDIPQWMVELKRDVMILKRLIKALPKE